MALFDIASNRAGHQPHVSKSPRAANKPSRDWRSVTREIAGTFFVLMGLAVGLLMLRFALVLMNGVLH